MKKPLLTYRILFLCAGLLLAAAGLLQAQTPCCKFVQASASSSWDVQVYGRNYLAIANDGTLWRNPGYYYWAAGSWIHGAGAAGLDNAGPGLYIVGRMSGEESRVQALQVGTDHDWKQAEVGGGGD